MSVDRKIEIEKLLLGGRDCAIHLRNLLESKNDEDDGGLLVSAEDLVSKISNFFSNALLILNSGESGEISRIQPANSADDSGESTAVKDQRGGYKRRKSANSRTRITQTLIDGYAWRKYGQKAILKSKFPRNYFRCTHKLDQGCKATKQVQINEDDPNTYMITYNGDHTCKTQSRETPPQIIFNNPTDEQDESSSILLNFESKIITEKNAENPISLFQSFPTIKREFKDHDQENTVTTTSTDCCHKNPSSDYGLLSPELTPFVSLESCDYYDDDQVISDKKRLSDNFDMDFMICGLEMDEFMQFSF